MFIMTKIVKSFKVGSSIFFSNYPDYKSKDTDEVFIIDGAIGKKIDIHKSFHHRKDCFFHLKRTKEEYIDYILNSHDYMVSAMFIVPEFCNWIGAEISDLELLDFAFNNLPSSHQYIKMIYLCYKENKGFFLTDEQRDIIYEEYKSKRKHFFNKD